MNNVSLIGRLTKDVELRFSAEGTPVATFTVAVNRPWDRENADFIQVVAFKKPAEIIADYFNKGSQIGINGRIQTRNYENNDGQRVYVTEVVLSDFFFLDKKEDDTQSNKGGNRNARSNSRNNSRR